MSYIGMELPPDSEFIHVGISTQVSKGLAVWYAPVTEDEYTVATK